MLRIHHFIKNTILSIVDFFYPLFKKFMTIQTYRYAACGGFNTMIDISLFFVGYNFIFKREPLFFPSINLMVGAHIAAFLVSFCVTFPIGFYLSRYVVFQETSVSKKEQLGKYFTVVLFCLVLNYGFLKLFVDVFKWYPTPSKILTTFFVVMFSYLSQKNFTFKSPSGQ